MADGAGLPSKRVDFEQLIPRASSAVLEESCCVSWLRLDLFPCLVLLARLLFRNGFRSPLEVFLGELELRQSQPSNYRVPLGFEYYVGSLPSVRGQGTIRKALRACWRRLRFQVDRRSTHWPLQDRAWKRGSLGQGRSKRHLRI